MRSCRFWQLDIHRLFGYRLRRSRRGDGGLGSRSGLGGGGQIDRIGRAGFCRWLGWGATEHHEVERETAGDAGTDQNPGSPVHDVPGER